MRTLARDACAMDGRTFSHFSFDVFDTFLLRRCTDPTGVFERAFQLAPIPPAKRGLRESFVQNRILAENRARELAHRARGVSEVSIAEIYEHFPVHVFALDNRSRTELIRAEFQAEIELCYVNPAAAAMFDKARAGGSRVGFISDTYWPADRLGELLRACRRGLTWNFLYASCDHGHSKSNGLIETYLNTERVAPQAAAHFGDNVVADIKSAEKAGVRAFLHDLGAARLAGIIEREDKVFRLLFRDAGQSGRLDSGLRTFRRVLAGSSPAEPFSARTFGTEVMGPVLTAFDRFVADRVERLSQAGGKVAVAFLGRDGLLPLRVWTAARGRPVTYIEVNRRIAMVGGGEDINPILDLFQQVPAVSPQVLRGFLKTSIPAIERWFAAIPGHVATGRQFASALPDLLPREEAARLATSVRKSLCAYLRAQIPELDACTDLVLIDLGYSGTVQRALRQVFDKEDIGARLHGLYLISVDAAFAGLRNGDSAEGMICDQILPPRAIRMLLRNVNILEQSCSAPEGSVSGYQNGGLVRENDPRSAEHLAIAAGIQDGVLEFARQSRSLVAAGVPDPYAELPAAAAWAGSILARALLMPSDCEFDLLGRMAQDTNLGSQDVQPMLDVASGLQSLRASGPVTAYGPNAAFAWPAGTMAAISPLHGYLYTLFSAEALSLDALRDDACGTVEVAAISGNGGRYLPVTCFRTAFGDLRLRIPLTMDMAVTAIVVPLGRLSPRGRILSVVAQNGADAAKAMASGAIETIPPSDLQALGMAFDGRAFEVTAGQEGNLVIPIRIRSGVTVVTLNIAVAEGQRVLADGGTEV